MKMSVPTIDQQSFPAHIASNDIVVVKFGAAWCGPCKAMAPMLEKSSSEFPGISIVEVDVDKSPHLAAQFNVRSLPTLVAWKGGQLQWAKIGLPNPAELRRNLEALQA
jgi:thioredoxin 1